MLLDKKNELISLYQKTLSAKLRRLEPERKRTQIKIIFFTVILAAASVYLFQISGLRLNTFFICIFIGPWILGTHFIKKNYRRRFKVEVMHDVMKVLLGQSVQFFPDKSIKQNQVNNSDLIRRQYNVFKGEDYLQGELGGLSLEMCELNLKHHEGKSTIKIFKGLFIEAQLPERINHNTYLMTKKSNFNIGWLGKLNGWSNPSKVEKIILESPEFDKEFEIFSNDQIQARVFLTPRVIKSLLDFRRKYPKDRIDVRVINKQLYILVHIDKNMFEPSIFGSNAFSLKDLRETYDVIRLIGDLSESLKIIEKKSA